MHDNYVDILDLLMSTCDLIKYARTWRKKPTISYDNEEDVKQFYNKLCERFEQFKSSHLRCLDICTQPEVREMETNVDSCWQNFNEFRERFSEWSANHSSNLTVL